MAVFDSLNEPEFVRRAVSGDSEAFRKLFNLLAAPLAVFVERMGVSAGDAEEVAADALVKVHRSLPMYRDVAGVVRAFSGALGAGTKVSRPRALALLEA